MDLQRRFGGIARLYGDSGLSALMDASVCVIGIGGVGSWAAEALARSAVGAITLIDLDQVAESNINRQLVATGPAIGRAKVDVLRERIATINPGCTVQTIEDFVTPQNLETLISPTHDWVMDCIDSFRIKAALIAFCRQRRQAILTTGGAGGQRDASRVRVSDLRKTEQDRLLASTRRLLRQDFGFPSNAGRKFRVPCVWSDEPPVKPQRNGGSGVEGSLNCAGYGSCMPVTATFGMVAAGYVIDRLVGAGRQR